MADLGASAYEALPGRVVFGRGALAALPEEVDRLGCRRALVIYGLPDPEPRRRLLEGLGQRQVGVIDDPVQHVPADRADAAARLAVALAGDCLVAVGGGSAIGLAKAVARDHGLPIVAVPTTYAGSEMTPIWGITESGRKTTGRDLAVLPKTVVYDPDLTLSFPPAASAASGMNAIAHCVEAMWTPAANPVTDSVASHGLALLADGLRAVVRDPSDHAARATALKGAWLGGTALAVGGTGLHHKICHVLGGTFDLPHAEVHAIVLPWVVDHYREAAPEVLDEVAAALGADDAVIGLRALADELGLAAGLADLGLTADDLDLAARLAAAVAPVTPAPTGENEIRRILESAMGG